MDANLKLNFNGGSATACYNRFRSSSPYIMKPSENVQARKRVDELSRKLRPDLLRLTDKIAYYLLFPVADEDLAQYLNDPIEALPAAICELLPKVAIVLVPYLEKSTGKASPSVSEEKPAEPRIRLSAAVEGVDYTTLFFAVKGEQVSDYHYYLYDELALIVSHRWPARVQEVWHGLFREELTRKFTVRWTKRVGI